MIFIERKKRRNRERGLVLFPVRIKKRTDCLGAMTGFEREIKFIVQKTGGKIIIASARHGAGRKQKRERGHKKGDFLNLKNQSRYRYLFSKRRHNGLKKLI
ncbi:MAG: hypothetical protein JF609_09775 [Verrucomicrobia bacterium]|nr:hypothetical protein [Verrucomicrobiota bacterium]